uniref:Uncharacterized protein n=1 Tax=Avena sativa TaxID=4498 RepID=A0ACD5XC02_AVESA
MLPEQTVQSDPPADDDGDGSSSDAHPDPISPATDEGIIQGGQSPELLWGPEVDISADDVAKYNKCLAPDIPPIYTRSMMTLEDSEDLELRLAHYRIAYYKNVADPESARKLKDPEDYSAEELQDNRYFLHLERHRSFEGCFHPDDTWVAEFDDYQRLLVYNGLPDSVDTTYIYWEDYHAYYRTYEVDEDYVKFYGELSSKVQWLKEYLHLEPKSQKWIEIGNIAARQALRIASRFTNLSSYLVGKAFDEYISELRDDKILEHWCLFYFEVWKLDAVKKKSLREAVHEAFEMEKFGLDFEGMSAERKAKAISIYKQKTEEDEVWDLLRKIVFKKFKRKNMAKYAQKKLEIEALMKLAPRKA